jgi:hypothetical protein
MQQKMILVTKCLQNYIVILDIHVHLFFTSSSAKAKKKIQGAQFGSCEL